MTTSTKPRKRRFTEQSVLDASLERMRYGFDLVDTVVVSFSGGKDSTAALHVVLEVAAERGDVPVKVLFLDEEVIPWETVEYMTRVADRPDVDLTWLCAPFALRNACSRKHPVWWSWAPEDRDRWARPLPDHPSVVTQVPGVSDVPPEDRPSFPASMARLYPPEWGTVGSVLGIRAAESVMRHRTVTWRKSDNWITPSTFNQVGGRNILNMYPIYDWTATDVWTAPHLYGWDYNHTYDVYEAMGVPVDQQRCSPAFGEEPIQGLYQWAEAFPDMWHSMGERVPGVQAAARYARTELYGYGGTPPKPPDESWGDWLEHWLSKHDDDVRDHASHRIRTFISTHRNYTKDPILPRTAHPVTGLSWRFLTRIAMRGDMKNRAAVVTADPARWEKWNAEADQLRAEGRFDKETRL